MKLEEFGTLFLSSAFYKVHTLHAPIERKVPVYNVPKE